MFDSISHVPPFLSTTSTMNMTSLPVNLDRRPRPTFGVTSTACSPRAA
ncbi:hypothetical protein PC114_g27036 [Phytophthora cactorum]|nr:hypothetical protein PC114_g27036 [Phytophthora cactorum]KAG3123571.1 hypothetical protein C6341_g26505 [Phytophthora cactorum]